MAHSTPTASSAEVVDADGVVHAASSVDSAAVDSTPTPSHTSIPAAPPSNFPAIDADADVERLTSLTSLCMNCHEDGETRLLLTSIPYFRDVIIMSFSCPHCHATSNEIQPASEIQLRGRRFILRTDHTHTAHTRMDLNRQIIRSETARIRIDEIDFEVEPTGRRGEINTVEGVLTNMADSLQVGQANRALEDVDVWRKVGDVIEQVRAMSEGQRSFTFILDDPAGNSFIENVYAPAADLRVSLELYTRTAEQTEELGYAAGGEGAAEEEGKRGGADEVKEGGIAGVDLSSGVSSYAVSPAVAEKVETFFNVSERSAVLEGQCAACSRECVTRMAVTSIPHFKEVVLMTTACDWCGYRDTEVKPAGRISERGIRIHLQVQSTDDLKRDLLKSDTAAIAIPDIDLSMEQGTLGGKYTTVEGILLDVQKQLGQLNPFAMGDSAEVTTKGRFAQFLEQLQDCIDVKRPFTFVLEDPLGNSHIWGEGVEGEEEGGAGAKLRVERYERSWQENEELGLNDVVVDVEQYGTEEDQALYEREMRTQEKEQGEGEEGREVRMEEVERKRQLEGVREGKVGGLIHVDEDQ